MARTRTGSFPIGFRRGGGWQKDLAGLIQWAKTHGFECLDVGPLPAEELKSITAAGLRIGTVDFKHGTGALASPDAGKRRAAAEANAQYINAVSPLGAKLFFMVMIPEDAAKSRRENHGYAVSPGSVASADVTHVNLNDGVIEGISCRDLPAFSVQYHPEAAPGPHDSHYLFDRFTALMEEARN